MKQFYRLTVWLLMVAVVITSIPGQIGIVFAENTNNITGLQTAIPAGNTINVNSSAYIDNNDNISTQDNGIIYKSMGSSATPATYTVTVSANPVDGGTVTSGGTYEQNTSVTFTATANEGYKFVGWYEDDIYKGDSASYDITVTEDCEIVAKFKKLYTVTFNSNNGTHTTDSVKVAEGDSITIADNVFSHGRYKIEGWSTEPDGSGYYYYVGYDMTVIGDVTLYAQWVLPLNELGSFTDGDFEWSGNTSSPYNFKMKNGAKLFSNVIFPAKDSLDKVNIIVDGDCEIEGNIAFERGTAQGGGNLRADLTIKGNGTLVFNGLTASGSGDTITIETDTIVKNGINIGASGGMDSKVVIKDATLTLRNDLSLLQYLTMEGGAILNIEGATASFHGNPQIMLSDRSIIYIGGNGFECVLYKEPGVNDAFDNLLSDGWLPAGYSFKLDSSGYNLYDSQNNLEINSITLRRQGHIVTFVDWNGREIDTQIVSDGSYAVAPANPTREGWSFTGWDKSYNNVTSDLIIMAQYTENVTRPSGGGGVSRYIIKFETNGGTAIANKYVTRNTRLKEPEEPEKADSTFEGWYTDKELTIAYDFDTKVTKGFTLYAKWSEAFPQDGSVGGTSGHNCPSLKFSDLDITKWYHHDTDYVIEKGIFKGTTETTFAPDDNITRAMMITVLYRAEGEPDITGEATFEDIDENAYYTKAVVWGQHSGIIKGYSETEYAPEQYITREQIAAIMHRYAEYKGYDVSVGENTNILSYDDFENISEYAIPSMQWAVGGGMIKGRTESTLSPEAFATRVEIAAMLHRFIEANK